MLKQLNREMGPRIFRNIKVCYVNTKHTQTLSNVEQEHKDVVLHLCKFRSIFGSQLTSLISTV